MAVFVDSEVADVDSVDEHGAAGDVVEAAQRVDEGGFAGAAGADESDHFPGVDFDVQVAQDGARAVAEVDVAQFDIAAQAACRDWGLGLWHLRHAIENSEYAMGAGSGAFSGLEHAAHGIQSGIEAADVSDEGREHADGDGVRENAPHTEQPDGQHANVSQQYQHGAEEGPGGVDAIVGGEHSHVDGAEAQHFAVFLGEGFDDADAGDGVGKDADHFSPGAVAGGEAVAEAVLYVVDEIGDEGQGTEGDDGEVMIDAEQDGRGHDEHEQISDEIEQVHAEEVADAVGVAADAGHQVAGALTAEEFERERHQVRVCLVAQVGGDALADVGEDVGLAPGEDP